MRLGGSQSRSGRGGEEKNSQPLPGIEAPFIRNLKNVVCKGIKLKPNSIKICHLIHKLRGEATETHTDRMKIS
jgi:hypothetical protein